MSALGSNFYVLGEKTTDVQTHLLGMKGVFKDRDVADTGSSVRGVNTGIEIEAIWVQSSGATALSGGTVVKWDTAYVGQKVSGVAGSAEVGAGLVDPFLTTTVAQNECFWMLRRGRVKATSGASYSTGAQLIPDTGGKLITMTADVAGLQARCARACEAAGAADQSKYVYLNFQM